MRLLLGLLGDVAWCFGLLFLFFLLIGRGLGPLEALVVLATDLLVLVVLVRKTLREHSVRGAAAPH